MFWTNWPGSLRDSTSGSSMRSAVSAPGGDSTISVRFSAVWYVRTGAKQYYVGVGHRELTTEHVRFRAVSLRIAQAIDDPLAVSGERNATLGLELMRAVGIRAAKGTPRSGSHG